MEECKKIGYKYDVVERKTMLLMGKDLDSAIDVRGWNIDIVKYEMWSDGDKVQCDRVTVTSTTKEKEVEYLKSVVKTSVVFSFVFELGITQEEAHEMFCKNALKN